MGFIKNIIEKIKTVYQGDYIDFEEEWDEEPLSRANSDMKNSMQRQDFVIHCLEQIKESSLEIDKLQGEYEIVTSYLKDMEEMESLPEEEKESLRMIGQKIVKIDQDRENYKKKKNRMSESQFRHMRKLESDMPEAYEKVKKAEEYQSCIKQDLVKLGGERHAYQFRHEELRAGIHNTKGMAMICLGAFLLCILLLLFLQFGLKFSTEIGYILAAIAVSITVVVLNIRHQEYRKEIARLERATKRLISLQNTVKIRYVNNTNLLEYLCVKYEIHNSNELRVLWEKYQEEKRERDRMEIASEELDYFKELLLNKLRGYALKDPTIWLRQIEALVDNREMVEIRHELIIRRQTLRKQLQYNHGIAEEANGEVKNLVESYPEYTKEILEMVNKMESAELSA